MLVGVILMFSLVFMCFVRPRSGRNGGQTHRPKWRQEHRSYPSRVVILRPKKRRVFFKGDEDDDPVMERPRNVTSHRRTGSSEGAQGIVLNPRPRSQPTKRKGKFRLFENVWDKIDKNRQKRGSTDFESNVNLGSMNPGQKYGVPGHLRWIPSPEPEDGTESEVSFDVSLSGHEAMHVSESIPEYSMSESPDGWPTESLGISIHHQSLLCSTHLELEV